MGLGVHNHLEFFKVLQKGQLRQVVLNVAKMLHTKACNLHLHAGKIPTIGVIIARLYAHCANIVAILHDTSIEECMSLKSPTRALKNFGRGEVQPP